MTDRTLILFAYHFPPDPAIGGARPFRFYKYLRRLGWRVHVITGSKQLAGIQEDVHSIQDPFETQRSGMGWHIERAVRFAFLPGVLGLRWAHAASRYALKLLPQSGKAAILSTFPPLGTHYAAWRLTRAKKLLWIADFRDPFGGPTLRLMPNLRPHHPFFFDFAEHRVIQSADLVIANTDSMAAQFKARNPAAAHKIELLWNGFDPECPLLPLPVESPAYRVLSHVGELYHGRNVTPILKSIGRLAPARLRVKIVGPADPAALPDATFLEQAGQSGWLELRNQLVSKAEARAISQTSDYLLLVQPRSAIQVPAKLFEYLQIGRPILAFITPDSAVERILSRAGVPYRAIYPEFSEQQMDRQIADFLSLPSDAVTAGEWFHHEFAAESQAKTLAAFIERLF